ncbi:MAG: carboxylating nicotinate-nucleotide diphosphorylase [Gammaproteobacteria bacterium]|nr:carboxylating nicotinate-nucleotide diphosphorylase [Gammaproteobacteria bacterium]
MSNEWAETVTETVRLALAEDVGKGDVTAALVPADAIAAAQVISREQGTICGQPWFDEVFRQVDETISVEWSVEEGSEVLEDSILCRLKGPARGVLTGERTALNFLQTLSGTATTTAKYSRELRGTECEVLDTRKTIPGLRHAQKYAVRCGGGRNHRMGLYDAILIKENHIAAAGGIGAAVGRARELYPDLLVEVEVEDLDQFGVALSAGCDAILLDNFSVQQMKKAAQKAEFLGMGRPRLEVSGNVRSDRLRLIAKTGVDYVSVGALTKNIRALDLSMRFL